MKNTRKRIRQRGCGICNKKSCSHMKCKCGKKGCLKHNKTRTKKGGCAGACMGGSCKTCQRGGLGSSIGFIDNAATVGSNASTSFLNIFRGISGLPALPTYSSV